MTRKVDQLCDLMIDLMLGNSKESESYVCLHCNSHLLTIQYQPFFTTDETC